MKNKFKKLRTTLLVLIGLVFILAPNLALADNLSRENDLIYYQAFLKEKDGTSAPDQEEDSLNDQNPETKENEKDEEAPDEAEDENNELPEESEEAGNGVANESQEDDEGESVGLSEEPDEYGDGSDGGETPDDAEDDESELPEEPGESGESEDGTEDEDIADSDEENKGLLAEQKLEDTISGVKLEIPEGALSEEPELVVVELDIDIEGYTTVAFRISLLSSEGEEMQPSDAVLVTVPLNGLIEDAVIVWHNTQAEELNIVDSSSTDVTFETSSFSDFILANENISAKMVAADEETEIIPEVKLEDYNTDIAVKIPEGALSEVPVLLVEPKEIIIEGYTTVSFDISLEGSEGEKLQPSVPVLITIPLNGLSGGNIVVWHNTQDEELKIIGVSDTDVTFETPSFSDFILANETIVYALAADVGTVEISQSAPNGTSFYSFEQMTGSVKYDAQGLTEPVSGAYVEISVPYDMINQTVANSTTGELRGLYVPAAEMIESVEYRIDTDAGGTQYAVAKVNLIDLNSTAIDSFPYFLTFDPRMIPVDYELHAQADLYLSDGTLLAESEDQIFTPKYDPQVIYKYIVTNTNSGFKNDGQTIYGGDMNGDRIIDSPVNIQFMYNLQTQEDRNPYSFPNGMHKQRLLEEITVIDTLPTYYNWLTGETTPATFDAASNPGWSVVEVDVAGRPTKVSYHVENHTIDIWGSADVTLKEEVVLNLQFPGIKVNLPPWPNGPEYTDLITNTVSAELYPFNASEAELNNPEIVKDSINFRLYDISFNGNGIFTKQTNDQWKVYLDPGYMHYAESHYWLSMTNTQSAIISAITFKDMDVDERYYFKKLSSMDPNITEVWGLDENENRIELLFSTDQGWLVDSENIDSSAYSEILGYVAQVDSGDMLPEDVPAANRTYGGIELVFDEAFELNPGDTAHVLVTLGFVDPYHMEITGESYPIITNHAYATGNYELLSSGDTDVFTTNIVSSNTNVVAGNFHLSMTKQVINNKGIVDESMIFRLWAGFGDLGKGTILKNPKIIELLPIGVTYQRYLLPAFGGDLQTSFEPVVETIDNYLGTGRQAVIISLNDFKVGDKFENDLPANFFIDVVAKLTKDAMPDDPSQEDYLTNRVYFVADGLYPISDYYYTFYSNTMLEDTYNVDSNADTDFLIGASAKIILNLPSSVRSYKEIRDASSDVNPWISGGITTDYSSPIEYRLNVYNNSTEEIANLDVYDILPYYGDIPYVVGGSRGSGFRNILSGAVTAPEGFTVYYSTNPSPLTDSATAINDTSMGWTDKLPANIADVTAIKITMDEGVILSANELVQFIVPMTTPEYVVGENLYELNAYNDFTVSYTDGVSFGVTNNVYNNLLRRFEVNKVWDNSSGDRFDITVQLLQNGTNYSSTEYPTGQITISAANNWLNIFEKLPARDSYGNLYQYTVEEVGAGTGSLENYYTEIEGDHDAGFTITNTEYASIGDRIWEDTNGDGVQDAGEAGISGITVELVDLSTNSVIATAVTDENGNYLFEKIVPGTYKVVISTPEHYTQTFEYDNTLDGNTEIAVTAGENIEYGDFGFQKSYTYAVPEVTKIIEGVVPDGEEKEFRFTISPQITTASGVTKDTMPLPENLTVSILGAGTTSQNSFGDIIFTEIGTYIYHITEDELLPIEDYAGYGHDDTIYILIISVTYNGDYMEAEISIQSMIGEDVTDVTAVEFTNPYVQTGQLLIKKTVVGNLADKSKYFTFKINFDVEGQYTYTGSKSGVISDGETIKLKHGEYIEISGLPSGIKYSVEETDIGSYIVTSTGEGGYILSGMTREAAFVNTLSSVPKTGDDNTRELALLMLIIGAIGMVSFAPLTYQSLKRKEAVKRRFKR